MLRHLIFCLSLGLPVLASAQTVAAHVNTGLVLESLAETAVADSMLRQYQDSLTLGFQLLEREFEEKYTYLEKNREELSPKQAQALQQELQEMQQEAGVYQQESARMFEQRRGAYLQPIVDRVNDAISAYAKTNGINIVFDVAIGGVVVFADEDMDITDEVIGALGGE